MKGWASAAEVFLMVSGGSETGLKLPHRGNGGLRSSRCVVRRL